MTFKTKNCYGRIDQSYSYDYNFGHHINGFCQINRTSRKKTNICIGRSVYTNFSHSYQGLTYQYGDRSITPIQLNKIK